MYRQRIKIFLAIMIAVLVLLAGKLFVLQVVDGAKFRDQFELSQQRQETLPAQRGMILDRNGQILAKDQPCFDFCLDYRFIVADEKWIRRQARAIQKNDGCSLDQARERYQQRSQRTWELARQLGAATGVDVDAEAGRIAESVRRMRDSVGDEIAEQRQFHAVVAGMDEAVSTVDTVGAVIRPSNKRVYYQSMMVGAMPASAGEGGVVDTRQEVVTLACHLTGYVGPVSRQEQERRNAKPGQADDLTRLRNNYLSSDVIGMAGIERMCEEELRPVRGYMRMSRDGEILELVEAQPGKNVQLTVDIELQRRVTDLFVKRGVTGSAVILSVPEGEVLAVVSVPMYDLNTFRKNYPNLVSDNIMLPLLHRAVAGLYPPGSTAKVVSALAGAANGLSPATCFTCQGALNPEDRTRFKCHYANGHGSVDMAKGIMKSCNVYFYNIGRYLGAGKLAGWLELMGFAARPGTGLVEETSGNILPGRPLVPGDPMQWAIGQGSMTATPLQVANAMAAIARGKFASPVVIKGAEPAFQRDIPVDFDQLRAVRHGMWSVVNQAGGTGYSVFRAGGDPIDVVVCGKTGTADVEPLRVDLNGDGRKDPSEIARSGNMAWFAGYASWTDPKIAFSVIVEYVPGHGGEEAGPVARELVRICKELGYVK